jgi:nicotinamidase-related amidase
MSKHALIVVDPQNEFSHAGQRNVPNHATAITTIARWVAHGRAQGWPIAWVQHHNKPDESPAFVPGTWGAEFSPELKPRFDDANERLFQKSVFGAFTGTKLEAWLRDQGVSNVVIVGFYAHMCISTSVREALVRGFDVMIDPEATGAAVIGHARLGEQSADEVCRAALLHLTHMGASVVGTPLHDIAPLAPEQAAC